MLCHKVKLNPWLDGLLRAYCSSLGGGSPPDANHFLKEKECIALGVGKATTNSKWEAFFFFFFAYWDRVGNSILCTFVCPAIRRHFLWVLQSVV